MRFSNRQLHHWSYSYLGRSEVEPPKNMFLFVVVLLGWDGFSQSCREWVRNINEHMFDSLILVSWCPWESTCCAFAGVVTAQRWLVVSSCMSVIVSHLNGLRLCLSLLHEFISFWLKSLSMSETFSDPCKHWLVGQCYKGAKCKFYHVDSVEVLPSATPEEWVHAKKMRRRMRQHLLKVLLWYFFVRQWACYMSHAISS